MNEGSGSWGHHFHSSAAGEQDAMCDMSPPSPRRNPNDLFFASPHFAIMWLGGHRPRQESGFLRLSLDWVGLFHVRRAGGSGCRGRAGGSALRLGFYSVTIPQAADPSRCPSHLLTVPGELVVAIPLESGGDGARGGEEVCR